MSRVIVINSAKGGVGKTITSANIATELALTGHKTLIIDFSIGLSALDLVFDCERKVLYDLVDVIQDKTTLAQAIIHNQNINNLSLLAATQNNHPNDIQLDLLAGIIQELREEYEFIICDSPTGIGDNALAAFYYADEAIVVVTPDVSSVRSANRIINIMKTQDIWLDYEQKEHIQMSLLINRYVPELVDKGEALLVDDIESILNIDLIGVIPEEQTITNEPLVITSDIELDSKLAYQDVVRRLLGENVEFRFLNAKKQSLFKL